MAALWAGPQRGGLIGLGVRETKQKQKQKSSLATVGKEINKCRKVNEQKLTGGFDDVVRAGAWNLAPVLVHAPAVGGLSIALHRTETQARKVIPSS